MIWLPIDVDRAAAGVRHRLLVDEAGRQVVDDRDVGQVDVAVVGHDEREVGRAAGADRGDVDRLLDVDRADWDAARARAGDVLAQAVERGVRVAAIREHGRQGEVRDLELEVVAVTRRRHAR